MTTDKTDNPKKITPFSFMGSIFAAWFGVQTKANRERDFEQGKFHYFVIGGITFAILFVLFIVGIVKVVMHFAAVP
ncbi:MAG: hypothetical protein COA54_15235 [Thiotrichaceae bacterium]|nr:MAG: hypothetical protein COA54_15235 [Thiotrichaceae bacterium]